MKFESLVGFLLFCCVLFSSCDDDLRSVGGGIQPGGDDIMLEVDSLSLSGRTVSLNDEVFFKATTNLIGRYENDLYGSVQAEYMTEFYCPDSLAFAEGVDRIDSTRITFAFNTYTGDSIAPMGVSFYEVTKKLERNYYTNVDLSQYSDMSKLLASASFTVKNVPTESSSSKVRVVRADMGNWGEKLYQASKTANNPLANSKEFLKYLKGVYVKPTFGNGALLDVLGTSISVHYTTKRDTIVGDDKEGKRDSVMYTSRTLYLNSTAEVVQLNKVVNKQPSFMFTENTGALYVKSAAGTKVEIELPIKDIISKSEGKSVNLARLQLKGFTELEKQSSYDFDRTSTLLLINKDSLQSFFENPYKVEDMNSKLVYAANRNTSNNTYLFNNLAPMIEEYRKKEITENPKYVLISVTPEYVYNGNNSYSVVSYKNSMTPALTILRAKEGDIKLEMIYSSF